MRKTILDRGTRWLPPLALAGLLAITTGCGDASPTEPLTEPPAEPPAPILVLGDAQTEDSVATILTRAGIDVQMGGPYWEYDGSGLADVSAVIFLCGYEYNREMPASVQDMLLAFVADGGGLMTTEWMLWNAHHESGLQDIVAGITPARSPDGDYDYGGETYTRVTDGHPVAEGLPASFAIPGSDWSYSMTAADPAPSKSAQVVFSGSASGDAVVAGRHGLGRTVHWNMGGEYNGSAIWSDEVRRLLVNIAKFISHRS